jgi:hypothetical protein
MNTTLWQITKFYNKTCCHDDPEAVSLFLGEVSLVQGLAFTL